MEMVYVMFGVATAPPLLEKMAVMLFEQSIVLTVVYAIMFVVCFYDRFTGISKARKAGRMISSERDREGTGQKLLLYFSLLFIATMLDFVQMLATSQWEHQMDVNLPQVPLFTIAIAIWIGSVEWKSIYEKFEDKERAKMEDTARVLAVLLKHREKGMEMLLDMDKDKDAKEDVL